MSLSFVALPFVALSFALLSFPLALPSPSASPSGIRTPRPDRSTLVPNGADSDLIRL